MVRLRYLVRAFFLVWSLGGLAMLVYTVTTHGHLERAFWNVAATAVLVGAPLVLLLGREVGRVIVPSEERTRTVLVGGAYDGGLAGLAATVLRGLVGGLAFGMAGGLAMSFSFVVAPPLAALAWLIGFGERRVTYVPSMRALLQEGWLIPWWTSVDRVRCVSVHVTSYHRPGSSYVHQQMFRPVVLLTSGARIDLSFDIGDEAEAVRVSQRAAGAMGVPYFANPVGRTIGSAGGAAY